MNKLISLKNEYVTKAYLKLNNLHEAFMDEEGLGTMELVLIMIVLIAIVIVFKDKVTDMIKNLISKIESKANGLF